jgi:hypothetical protein
MDADIEGGGSGCGGAVVRSDAVRGAGLDVGGLGREKRRLCVTLILGSICILVIS